MPSNNFISNRLKYSVEVQFWNEWFSKCRYQAYLIVGHFMVERLSFSINGNVVFLVPDQE